MGKKKKEIIRIIRKDSNKENYTFVSNDNVLNNIKDNNKSATTTNNEKMFENKLEEIIEKKKIHSKSTTKAERF
jgi:hypothetical protein